MDGDLDSRLSDAMSPLAIGLDRRHVRTSSKKRFVRSKSGYRRRSSRRMSTMQQQRRATFAAIPGADTQGAFA